MYSKFIKVLYKYLVEKYQVEGHSKYEIIDAIMNAMRKVNLHLGKDFRKFIDELLNIIAKTDSEANRQKRFFDCWKKKIQKFPATLKTLKGYKYAEFQKLNKLINYYLERTAEAKKLHADKSRSFYTYDPAGFAQYIGKYIKDYPKMAEVIDAVQNVISPANPKSEAIDKLVDELITDKILVQESDKSSAKNILKEAYSSGDPEKGYEQFVDKIKDFVGILQINKTTDQFINKYGNKVKQESIADSKEQKESNKELSIPKDYKWLYIGGVALVLTIIVILMIVKGKRRKR